MELNVYSEFGYWNTCIYKMMHDTHAYSYGYYMLGHPQDHPQIWIWLEGLTGLSKGVILVVKVYYSKRIHSKISWERIRKSRVQQRAGMGISMSSLSGVMLAVLLSPSNNVCQYATSVGVLPTRDAHLTLTVQILLEVGHKDIVDYPWDWLAPPENLKPCAPP